MIFNYANESHYKEIANNTNGIKTLLELVTEECRASGTLLGCSLIFIPCNLTTGAPIPLCSNDCFSYDSICENVFSNMVNFAKFYDYPFIQNCENTLSHLNTHINYPNSSSDFKDNCLALPGMYVICSVSGQLFR